MKRKLNLMPFAISLLHFSLSRDNNNRADGFFSFPVLRHTTSCYKNWFSHFPSTKIAARDLSWQFAIHWIKFTTIEQVLFKTLSSSLFLVGNIACAYQRDYSIPICFYENLFTFFILQEQKKNPINKNNNSYACDPFPFIDISRHENIELQWIWKSRDERYMFFSRTCEIIEKWSVTNVGRKFDQNRNKTPALRSPVIDTTVKFFYRSKRSKMQMRSIIRRPGLTKEYVASLLQVPSRISIFARLLQRNSIAPRKTVT